MHDWQQRVVEEKKELDIKIAKLVDFLSQNRKTLVAIDYDYMQIQLYHMKGYSDALKMRIGRFE